MLKWNSLRRLVAVALLVGSLVVLPAPGALAADEESGQAAESEDQGIVQDAIDWLIDLLGGGDQEADMRAGNDPMGLS